MTNKGSKSSLLKEDTDKEEGLNEGRAGYPDMSLEEKFWVLMDQGSSGRVDEIFSKVCSALVKSRT